jgi:hypothetical protein
MTMMTKEELLEDLRALQVGHTRAAKGAEMSDIFGVCLSLITVKAWLNKVGLSDFEVTEGGGTTSVWIFERRG